MDPSLLVLVFVPACLSECHKGAVYKVVRRGHQSPCNGSSVQMGASCLGSGNQTQSHANTLTAEPPFQHCVYLGS